MYYIWDFLEEKLAIWMKTLALFIPQDPVYYTKMLSSVWLCNLMDCTPPDSSVHGISQARVLEWAAISFPRGSSWPRDQTCGSCSISCIAGRFFNPWATGEAQYLAWFPGTGPM